MVDAAQGRSQNDKAILSSCVGLCLFGVPNRGLNNENLLSLVKENKMAPFVHNLMEGSELLQALHVAFLRSYKDALKSCYVVSFYETRDTKTVEVSAMFQSYNHAPHFSPGAIILTFGKGGYRWKLGADR